jgi:predicted nucleic acid-binding protein
MNPPLVLLDHSFLSAVHEPDDPNHDDAVSTYRALVDDFVEQRCLLVARADHLSAVADRDLFAPVDKLHVARQHRNAANDVVARTGIDVDEAITLVMIRRSKVRKVATFDERLASYDIVTIGPTAPDGGNPDMVASDIVARDTLDTSTATTSTDGAA